MILRANVLGLFYWAEYNVLKYILYVEVHNWAKVIIQLQPITNQQHKMQMNFISFEQDC